MTTSFDGTQISLLTGKGDGTFASLRNMPVGAMPRALAIADLDSDGKQDVIVALSVPTDEAEKKYGKLDIKLPYLRYAKRP